MWIFNPLDLSLSKKKCYTFLLKSIKIVILKPTPEFCILTTLFSLPPPLENEFSSNYTRFIRINFQLQEKILIDCSNSQLASGILEVEEYIERMKAAKEDLESLRSFKYENYGIECDNINLKQSSSVITLNFGSTREWNK